MLSSFGDYEKEKFVVHKKCKPTRLTEQGSVKVI